MAGEYTRGKAIARTLRAKTYVVNDVFFSLQGEGARAGTPNVFIRFTGCNMRCDIARGALSPGGFACDTEFESGRALSRSEVVAAARKAAGERKGIGIILTGGEPGLQADAGLVEALKAAKFSPICIETNGTVDVSRLGLDWISLSPKVAEHAIRLDTCDELRYVRAVGQGIPKPRTKARNKFISPAYQGDSLDRETLEWCVRLVKGNPGWALSVQQHKFLGLR